MSSRKTGNYQLNQWDEDDLVLRESFNADNLAIDSALATLASSKMDAVTGQASLASHTNSKSNPHGVTAAQVGAAAASHNHAATNITSGTLPIARGGTGNTTGLAASATKLATARTVRTNLAATTTASFDGTANIAPGVTGTLPAANGGTGLASLAALSTALKVPTIVTGTYTGNNAVNRTISLGFTPIAVLLMLNNGATYNSLLYWGGLAVTNGPVLGNASHFSTGAPVVALEIVTGGFQVHYHTTSQGAILTNDARLAYCYLAIK